MIKNIQKRMNYITKLVILQWFKTHIIDGKDAHLLQVLIGFLLHLEHLNKIRGTHHTKRSCIWIAIIVKVGRILLPRQLDQHLQCMYNCGLAIAWLSSKEQATWSLRITDPATYAYNARLHFLRLLIDTATVCDSSLVELQENLICTRDMKPGLFTRSLPALCQPGKEQICVGLCRTQ